MHGHDNVYIIRRLNFEADKYEYYAMDLGKWYFTIPGNYISHFSSASYAAQVIKERNIKDADVCRTYEVKPLHNENSQRRYP